MALVYERPHRVHCVLRAAVLLGMFRFHLHRTLSYRKGGDRSLIAIVHFMNYGPAIAVSSEVEPFVSASGRGEMAP